MASFIALYLSKKIVPLNFNNEISKVKPNA